MAERKSPSPRDVQYEVKTLDSMPEHGTRASVLEEALEAIKKSTPRDAEGNSVWCQIGSYRLGSAASAAANQLRKRHGRSPEVNGWRFTTGKQTKDEAGNPVPKDKQRTILAARYEPEAIVEGEAQKHAERQLKDKDVQRAKRQNKKAEGKAEGNGSAAKAEKAHA